MRAGIYIIDLEQTILMIRRALHFIKKVCDLRGHIFYLPASLNPKGGHSSYLDPARATILSPNKQLPSSRRPNRPLGFRPFLVNQIQKKHIFGGSASRDGRSFLQPEALFVHGASSSLSREAAKLQIPVIAVLDSDSNPYGVQYPIPGNDDSSDAISLYTELFINAVAAAKKNELKKIPS